MSSILAFALSRFHNFSSDGRCVNWLYRSQQCDIMLTCWEPGQASSYHDHHESESVVCVIEGRVTVLSEGEERRYEAGQMVVTPRGVKHQLCNDDRGRLVTLHVYAPHLEGNVSAPMNDYTAPSVAKLTTRCRGGSDE